MVELNSTWEELAGGIGGGAFPELGTAELPDWLQAWYDAKAEASQIVAAVQSGQAPPEALRYVEQIMSSTGGDYDSPPESAEAAAEASGLFDSLFSKQIFQDNTEEVTGNYAAMSNAFGVDMTPAQEQSYVDSLAIDGPPSESRYSAPSYAPYNTLTEADRAASQDQSLKAFIEDHKPVDRAPPEIFTTQLAREPGYLYPGKTTATAFRDFDSSKMFDQFTLGPSLADQAGYDDGLSGMGAVGGLGYNSYGALANYDAASNFSPEAYASGDPNYNPNASSDFLGDLGTSVKQGANSFLDGVKGLFNSIGTDEYNAPGILESIISNPLSISGGRRTSLGVQSINEARGRPDMGAKFAAYAPSIAARLMGGPGMALGLFGGALNAAGAFHDFDSSKDSNAFFDSNTGMVAWDSTDPGGGGYQEGWLNAGNMFKDMDPDTDVATNDGLFTTAGQIANYVDIVQGNAVDPYADVDGISAADYLDSGKGTPYGFMDSNFAGLTNAGAFDSLSNYAGNAFNSVMGDAQARGLGYNESIAAVDAAADAMANEAASADAQAQADALGMADQTPDWSWSDDGGGGGADGFDGAYSGGETFDSGVDTDDGGASDGGAWY